MPSGSPLTAALSVHPNPFNPAATIRYAPDRTASGVYFLRLETASGTQTEKLVLLK